MHLLEAAQFKKKYQMKKNAIDGMMTNMNDSNFHWAHEIGGGKLGKPKKSHLLDSHQFPDQSRNVNRQTNLSTNLKKDLMSGSGLTHEYNRLANTGIWGTNTNKST